MWYPQHEHKPDVKDQDDQLLQDEGIRTVAEHDRTYVHKSID